MDTLSIVLNSIFFYSIVTAIITFSLTYGDLDNGAIASHIINAMTVIVIMIIWFARML